MYAWQKAFREGIGPNLSPMCLTALRKGLENDDPELMQGATTSPPPLECVADWPVTAVCALAYAGWKGDGRKSVREVADFFADICYLAGQALGEPAAVRYFLDWFDHAPREEMRRALLAEVNRAIVTRCAEPAPEGRAA
jgi:hypothetical protein